MEDKTKYSPLIVIKKCSAKRNSYTKRKTTKHEWFQHKSHHKNPSYVNKQIGHEEFMPFLRFFFQKIKSNNQRVTKFAFKAIHPAFISWDIYINLSNWHNFTIALELIKINLYEWLELKFKILHEFLTKMLIANFLD